jgi:hypothetical protein
MRAVEVLEADWERLRRARPGTDPVGLLRAVVDRGRRLVAEEVEATIAPDAPVAERVAWLRRRVPRKAASVATLGFDLVMTRRRLDRAVHLEERVSRRYVELNREVIPALKRRAEELRSEIRRLEGELRARGGDPGSVLPEAPARIELDDYRPVEFEGRERRQRAIDLFRRIGGER